MYFENRFEFYDLVIKRGVMLVATIVALGLVFAVVQPLMDQLPPGPVRPWLVAMLLVPAAMALPWLPVRSRAASTTLWFGREFTPVEAVKHLLGAMQPATGEETLIVEAERRSPRFSDGDQYPAGRRTARHRGDQRGGGDPIRSAGAVRGERRCPRSVGC